MLLGHRSAHNAESPEGLSGAFYFLLVGERRRLNCYILPLFEKSSLKKALLSFNWNL